MRSKDRRLLRKLLGRRTISRLYTMQVLVHPFLLTSLYNIPCYSLCITPPVEIIYSIWFSVTMPTPSITYKCCRHSQQVTTMQFPFSYTVDHLSSKTTLQSRSIISRKLIGMALRVLSQISIGLTYSLTNLLKSYGILFIPSYISEIIDKHVPNFKTRSNQSNEKRYPKSILRLQSRKLMLWRKWRSTNDAIFKTRYLEISKQCRKEIYDHVLRREAALVDSNNAGNFYKYVNRKMASRTGIGVLKGVAGEDICDPGMQAEALNEYFASTFVDDDGILPNFPSRVGDIIRRYHMYRSIKKQY